MKHIFAILFLLSCTQLHAQPWLEKFEGQQPKLTDIVEAYKTSGDKNDDAEKDYEAEFEGKGHHFQRWLNFWEGRTDANGRLISTAKHWEELKKLQARTATNNSAAKGTSVDVNWTFHGPANPLGGNSGVGRINVVEFHPTDTAIYMIGSPGGGLWRTTDDGNSWQVLNDFFPVLGISDIDYNPTNPNTIYVCTGDRDATDTYSLGVFKSTDGGTTWDTTGFRYKVDETKKTYNLIVNAIDTNILTLACSDGIYKSYDAAKTWHIQKPGNSTALVQHPTDTAIMYTLGTGGQFFRSADGGHNWQTQHTIPGTTKIEIAVTKANPAIVKLVAANTAYGLEGIYNSTDTGKTFTKIFDDANCDSNILASTPDGDECGGQGWYDLTIQISPINENIVIVGGVNTWLSTTGGTTWKVMNQWKNTVTGVTIVHADKHQHKFHPLAPGVLFECNDGGIFKTLTPSISNGIWNDLTMGLGITQFYRNAVASNTNYVLGGAQDNGSKMLTGGTSVQMTGADGMDCQIDPTDSTILYTSQQYGELRRSTDGGKTFTDIQNNIPGKPSGSWITPLLIHPLYNNLIFAGYNYVYYSSDFGDSWKALSPNFFTNATRLAATAQDEKYLYVAMANQSNNTIRYTTDLGNNWKIVGSLISNTYVSDIMVDPRRKDSLWVTFRDYAGVKVAVVDVKTNLWTNFSKGLPEIPVNCISFDLFNQTFYAGTDLGVFYREYNDTAWQYFNNNTLPNVEVTDLGINHTSNTLWAATYGRGMWSSPVHKSTTGIATIVPLANALTIYPNPNNGVFSLQTEQAALKNTRASVRIINLSGAVLSEQPVQINSVGKAEISATLARGTYVVEIIKDNTLYAKTKMVVY